ncbi:hypothetical protein BH09BAC1_BH09BAC1_10040 [soil metagenome]
MILVLEKEFARLEKQRKDLLSEVRGLTNVQQTWRPNADSWSLLEVFVHLMTAERNGLTYMTKKVQGIDELEKGGITSDLRLALLNSFLRLPVKYEAPAAAQFQPREYYDFKEIEAEWDQLRKEWHEFLDEFDKDSAEKLLFKHPIMGRFNLEQTLRFIYEHVDHHVAQVKRLKDNPNFPRS